jgi:hypothetical protein
MSAPIQMIVQPTQETRMGRMLAAGRLMATMTSEKTGVHMTVEFASKVKVNNRWQNSNFADATHVFISGGRGNKVATYYPQKGNLYFSTDDKAWQYAAKEILLASTRIQQDVPGVYRVEESSHCGRCGLELTDPVSIARGLGPHCADMETGSTHYKAQSAPLDKLREVTAANVAAGGAIYEEIDNSKPERLEAVYPSAGELVESLTDKKGRVLPSTFAELAARVG